MSTKLESKAMPVGVDSSPSIESKLDKTLIFFCLISSIKAILPIEKKEYFRRLWFDYSNTIGVRERTQSRWILLRRRGVCSTTLGNIKVKQTLKPDGSITMKPENDEVLRVKLAHKISNEKIRKIINESSQKFKAFENWQ